MSQFDDLKTEVILFTGGGKVTVKDCTTSAKQKAFVIPYVIEGGEVHMLMGVKRTTRRDFSADDYKDLYTYHFFGGTCDHSSGSPEQCALRELCEESLSTLNFQKNDLINLGTHTFDDPDSYNPNNRQMKCNTFVLYAVKLNISTSTEVLEQRINDHAAQSGEVGLPCYENDFVKFVGQNHFDELLKNQYVFKNDFENSPYPWSQSFSKNWRQRYQNFKFQKKNDVIREGIPQRYAEIWSRAEQDINQDLFAYLALVTRTVSFDLQTSINNKSCDCQAAHLEDYIAFTRQNFRGLNKQNNELQRLRPKSTTTASTTTASTSKWRGTPPSSRRNWRSRSYKK